MKALVAILSCTTLLSLAAAIYFATQQPAPPPAPVVPKTPDAARVQELETQLAAATNALKVQGQEVRELRAKASAPQVAAPAAPQDKAAQMQESLAKMMSDPAMRDMMVAQQQAQVEGQFAGLFDLLQLDSEEKLHFKKLLSERVKSKISESLKLMTPGLSVSQQKEIAEQIKATLQASDDGIRTFMNDDTDFQRFKRWEDSMSERAMVNMNRMVFEEDRVPLSSEQENQLIDLMATVRSTNTTLPDMRKPEAMVGVNVDQPFLQRQLAKIDADHNTVLANAPNFLRPDQIPALQKMLERNRQLLVNSMKMAQQMTK
jgi:hypothetical protein